MNNVFAQNLSKLMEQLDIQNAQLAKPVMVYSDQLMLIDEFQRHFDSLWSQTDIYGSKRHVIGELITLRNQCAKHLNS